MSVSSSSSQDDAGATSERGPLVGRILLNVISASALDTRLRLDETHAKAGMPGQGQHVHRQGLGGVKNINSNSDGSSSSSIISSSNDGVGRNSGHARRSLPAGNDQQMGSLAAEWSTLLLKIGVSMLEVRVSAGGRQHVCVTEKENIFTRSSGDMAYVHAAVAWNSHLELPIRAADLLKSTDITFELFCTGSHLDRPVCIARSLPISFMDHKYASNDSIPMACIPLHTTGRVFIDHRRSTNQRPQLHIKLQWLQELSTGEQRMKLLGHVVNAQSEYLKSRANDLRNEPIGVTTSTRNFDRFVIAVGEMWAAQQFLADLFLWQNTHRSLTALAIWLILSWYMWLIPSLGLILMLCVLMRRRRAKVEQTGKYIPRSRRATSVKERLANIQGIQNFMKQFSDIVDALYELWDVHLDLDKNGLHPRLNFHILASLPFAALAGYYVPAWIWCLTTGWFFLLAGNPYCMGLFYVILFELRKSLGRRKMQMSKSELMRQARNAPSAQGDVFLLPGTEKIKTAIETERWWIGHGWHNESWDPAPLEALSPPLMYSWAGLWKVADSWEYSLGPPWSTKFHKEMGVADLVRRRVWSRSIQRAQRTPSGSGDTEELREASKVSTDTSLQFESEDVNEIEVFENQRWWLGRGWAPIFWPADPPAWSDRQGVAECTREWIDTKIKLMPDSSWIDEWHLEDGGWRYATDFMHPFSTRGDGTGTTTGGDKPAPLDFVRRRRWVRSCKINIPSKIK